MYPFLPHHSIVHTCFCLVVSCTELICRHLLSLAVMSSAVYNSFTPDSAKSKIDKFSKITNWVNLKNKPQRHSKVQLSNEWSHFSVLSMENFVSPKVSLWESKG